MRALLHFGLFVLALTAVGQASADHGNRRRERHSTVVIAPPSGHPGARPARVPVQPPPPRNSWHRARDSRARGIADARRELYEEKRDHQEIVGIANRWTQAIRERNAHAQRNAERRIQAWIDREIAESSRKPDNGRYVYRLYALRRELSGGYGRHRYGRRSHLFDARKAHVLGELVELSERQVRRAAHARARNQMHMAFAYR